jgi:hypothetical protein
MNNLLHNKHFVFGDLGDFWYRQQSESNQYGIQFARAFSHLLDNNNSVNAMSGAIQRLSGEGQVYKSNYTISFNPLDVRILNFNINQRYETGSYPSLTVARLVKYSLPNTGALQIEALPLDSPSPAPEDTSTTSSNTLADSDYGNFWFPLEDSNRTVLFSTDEARPLYFVPIPLALEPISITTNNRELTVGCSFVSGPGYLLFYEDPYTLFPGNNIFVRNSLARESHTMDYVYQVDNLYSDGRYIAAYMRATHSVDALKLALSEIAGLPILHEASVLQQIYENYDVNVYEFDTQVISVPNYIEHAALSVGTTYPAGMIFGTEYVKIYSAANISDTPWYRTSDLDEVWSADGLSIDTITPFTGIVVPDFTGTFAYNGSTAGGGTAHYYISGVTGGNTGDYWAFVRASETYTNKYLASATVNGATGITAGTTANCINFYFDNMLTYNSVVIKLRTQELGTERHQNVMSFIRRDLPINVTPIILT